MLKMIAVFSVCVLSLLGLTVTTPLEDDFRALKAEMDELKSKTDKLDHNYTVLQEKNDDLVSSIQLIKQQQSAQLQQNVQSLQQDLLFIHKEVNNLSNISHASRQQISLLQTANNQNDVKAMTKLAHLNNLTSMSNMKTDIRLLNLEKRIGQENNTIMSMQKEGANLNTRLFSHIQDYAALKNTVKAVEHEVHSTIAFKAAVEGYAVSISSRKVKYNQVLINMGNAYNSATGRFTCPRNGLYRFTAVVNNYDSYRLHFRLNGNKVPNYSNGTSISTLLELNRNDAVWIETIIGWLSPTLSLTGSFRGYLISTN